MIWAVLKLRGLVAREEELVVRRRRERDGSRSDGLPRDSVISRKGSLADITLKRIFFCVQYDSWSIY